MFSSFPGNAEVYIILALLIGLTTVVVGCWLSDNCWSPEPEGPMVTIAWPKAKLDQFESNSIIIGMSFSSLEMRQERFGIESPGSSTPLVEVSKCET